MSLAKWLLHHNNKLLFCSLCSLALRSRPRSDQTSTMIIFVVSVLLLLFVYDSVDGTAHDYGFLERSPDALRRPVVLRVPRSLDGPVLSVSLLDPSNSDAVEVERDLTQLWHVQLSKHGSDVSLRLFDARCVLRWHIDTIPSDQPMPEQLEISFQLAKVASLHTTVARFASTSPMPSLKPLASFWRLGRAVCGTFASFVLDPSLIVVDGWPAEPRKRLPPNDALLHVDNLHLDGPWTPCSLLQGIHSPLCRPIDLESISEVKGPIAIQICGEKIHVDIIFDEK